MNLYAKIAEKHLLLSNKEKTNSVLIPANPQQGEKAELITKQESVNGVEKNSLLINTQNQKPVQDHADFSCVGIRSIKKIGREPVYNMEVDDNHNFAINGGLIVHNCMDALRYFVKSKHIVRKAIRR